ncbi:hypothetical protein HNR00_003609 [Methylorubrum rhodinum]|uniref:Uncharacterized protein n=1 Tax=Methylorubrum rhodinum TaxID=29428 RepID=A0A840ZL90_9HYPH|nr:hypothetical protein [Methylorubrum rhodinum]
MANLILAPSGLPEERLKPWALQLRYHDCCGPTEYAHVCFVSEATAREIVKAGAPYFLYSNDREKDALALPPAGGR